MNLRDAKKSNYQPSKKQIKQCWRSLDVKDIKALEPDSNSKLTLPEDEGAELLLVSKEFKTSDFSYWLIATVRFELKLDNTSNGEFKNWMIEVRAIAPEYLEDLDTKKQALCYMEKISHDANPDEIDEIEETWKQATDLEKVECLAEYGVGAVVFFGDSRKLAELVRTAIFEANCCSCLFGFYMDRYQNRLGATGWDLLQGNVWGSVRH